MCVTAHNTHTPFSCRAPTILTQQLTQGALYTWSTLHRADGLLIYLLFPTHFVSSGSYRRKERTFTCIESVRCYSLLSQSVAYVAGFFFSLALFVTNHFSCLNRLRNFRARDIIRFCSQLMFEQFCFFFFFLLVVAKSTRQYPGHASIKYYNFHHLFVHRYIYIYILFSYAFWLASVSREQLRATLSLTHIHAPLLIISYNTFSLLSIYI